MGSPEPYLQSKRVMRIFDLLGHSPRPIVDRAYGAVRYMLDEGLSATWITDLPLSVAVPILEAIRACRIAPGNWAPEVYDFVGRQDLAHQASNVELEIKKKEEVRTGEMELIVPD